MEKKAIEQNGRVSKMAVKKSVLRTQVGGTHYKQFYPEPIQFFWDHDIPFCYANVLKYVLRYRFKNGVEDLRKAAHCLDYAIERETKNRKLRSLKISDALDFIEKNKLVLNEFQIGVLKSIARWSEKGDSFALGEAKQLIGKEIYWMERGFTR